MFIEFIGEFAIMKDLNLDHFSPSTAVIDPKYTLTRTPDPNFSFAFNNKSSSTVSSRSRLWPTPTPIQGGISHNLDLKETIGEVVAVERSQKPGPGCRNVCGRKTEGKGFRLGYP
ncbi:hypothetical protein P3S68_025977 [Capsicum galapagoense]